MHVAKDSREKAGLQPPWTLAEGPMDPESYVDKASKLWELSRLGRGFPSFWSTAEYKTSSRILQHKLYHGDQGPYGHEKRRPAGWSSSRKLPSLHRGVGAGYGDGASGKNAEGTGVRE